MLSFVRQKGILEPLHAEPHAFAQFTIDATQHDISLVEDIAIGQSLGAWEDSHVDPASLARLVAKLVSVTKEGTTYTATLAFPWGLWHGRLHWLLALLFGKMSFYEGVQLSSVWFSEDCFAPGKLTGPLHSTSALRTLSGAPAGEPLLMGILKPNVAMSPKKIADLYVEAAEAGCHLLKDDEIRHDADPKTVLARVEAVATEASKRGLKTLYAVHAHFDFETFELNWVKDLEAAGAQALLVNVWTTGLGALQTLRGRTQLPILAHPALLGAFGLREDTATLHPRVSMAQLVRAAGADLTLFPSPYGKLGLPLDITQKIASAALATDHWPCKGITPVPSAGIKPEHASPARRDFGSDFVLNAGTGIFAGKGNVTQNIRSFRAALYGEVVS